MNRQQENNCIAYFKSNPVWDRVFRGFWEKYRSYGSFSGKVVLQKITAEEVEGLEGFFAKSFHGKKSVTVSAERFSQALLSSRFSNMTPEHLLELYFREKLVGKKVFSARFGDAIESRPGAPKLVPESAKGVEYSPLCDFDIEG